MTVLGYCEPSQNRSRRLPLQFRYRHKGMGKKAGKDGGSEAGKERTRFGTRRKRKQYVCEITYPLRAMVLTQLSRLLEKIAITDHGIFSALPPMIELRMNLFFDPSFSLRRSRCLGCKKKRTVKFSLISP